MNTAVRRHPAPKVLGILSLVFGGIVVLLTLVGLTLSGAGALDQLPGSQRTSIDQYLSAIEPAATILMVAMIAMSVGLMVIGIGQLGYKRWARQAAIIWSFLGFLVVAGLVLHHYMSVVPAFTVFLDSLGDFAEMRQMLEGSTSAGGILSVVMYLPYPIVQLVLMRKPAVVAAMSN